jgi:hypothetical protein
MRFKLQDTDKEFVVWNSTTWNKYKYYEGIVIDTKTKEEVFAICLGNQVITETEHYFLEEA